MLIHPKLLDMCNHWINHETSINLIDVYDGDIWKEFMNSSDPKTLKIIALMIGLGLTSILLTRLVFCTLPL